MFATTSGRNLVGVLECWVLRPVAKDAEILHVTALLSLLIRHALHLVSHLCYITEDYVY